MTEMPSDSELEALPPHCLLQLGIDLHNEQRFFEAHEAWEAAWLRVPDPLRAFYQGLIQITAAFVHLSRNEYPGTHRLLHEGLAKISRYQPDFLGIITDRLAREAEQVRDLVLELGPRGLGGIELSQLPRVHQQPTGDMRTLGTPGRALNYLEWPGHGGTVVLLHGAGLIANLWWPVAARLSQRWRVLAPDLPGHGRSDARPGGAQLTINALAAWAAAVAPDPATLERGVYATPVE